MISIPPKAARIVRMAFTSDETGETFAELELKIWPDGWSEPEKDAGTDSKVINITRSQASRILKAWREDGSPEHCKPGAEAIAHAVGGILFRELDRMKEVAA